MNFDYNQCVGVAVLTYNLKRAKGGRLELGVTGHRRFPQAPVVALMRCLPHVRRLAAVVLWQLLWPAGPAAAQGLLEQIFGFGAPKPAVMIVPQTTRPKGLGGSTFASPSSRRGGEGETRAASGGAYRTVCVRMCDGFYVPMSFATTRENFYQDQMRCRSTCGDDARLFFHRNPGSSMEDAVDLSGRAYSHIPNAFRFRKTLVSGCTCRPPPWSEAERARHQSYAAAEQPATATTTAAVTPLAATRIAAKAERMSGAVGQPDGAGHDGGAAPQPDTARVASATDTTDIPEPAAKPKIVAVRTPRREATPPPVRVVRSAAAPTVMAPSPSSGLFGFGAAPSMGLGAPPKYTWPGDAPARR